MTRNAWILLAGACLLTFVLYLPALHGPFVFDDFPNLAALAKYPQMAGWKGIALYLSEARGFPGRPLAMLSFYPQRAAWPASPLPFKLINTLLHLGCGLLLARWLLLLSRTRQQGAPASLIAAATAALWLLHPIQLSTVMLVIQRMTILATAFMLIGLTLYTLALTRQTYSRHWRLMALIAGIAICGPLALLCKETGALLPLYAWILDSTLLRQARTQLPPSLRMARRLLVVLPASILLGGMILLLPWLAHGYALRAFTLPQRLLTEPRIVCDYLYKIILPQFGPYGLYNDDYPLSTRLLQPLTTLPALAAVLGSTLLAWFKRKQWPLFAFAVFWYLGGQWLESTAISLELYFEHRSYLPMVGPLYAIVAAVAELPADRRRTGLLILWTWGLACLLATGLSARVWGQQGVLAQVWASHHPHSERAVEFLASDQLDHGHLDAAIATMQPLASARPNDPGIQAHRIYLACLAGTLTTSDLAGLRQLYASGPYQRESYDILGSLRELAERGQCPQVLNPASWSTLADALLLNPHLAVDPATLGYIHYQKHQLAADQGRLDEAIDQLQQTWKLDPDPEIPRLEAKYLASAGLYPQAIQVLQQADASRLPWLRRLLVDDRSRWHADIQFIQHQQAMAHPAALKPAAHP